MPKHAIPYTLPSMFHPERHARNGQLPVGTMLHRLAMSLNTFTGRQGKLIFSRGQHHQAVVAGSASAEKVYPFFFRTGAARTGLEVIVGLANTDLGTAAQPNVTIDVRRQSDGASASAETVYSNGRASTSFVGPSDIDERLIRLTGLAPNTEYYVETTVSDGCRVVYMSAAEQQLRHLDDSVEGVVDPSPFIEGGDITDEAIARLITTANALRKQSAAHLLSWCPDYLESAGPTTTSTSYVNMLTGTPKITLPVTYHGTEMRSQIPVTIAARVDQITGSGATADVRLWDGTNEIAVTGMLDAGAPKWFSANAVIPAGSAQWDVQMRVSGGTWRLFGVSLFEYEA